MNPNGTPITENTLAKMKQMLVPSIIADAATRGKKMGKQGAMNRLNAMVPQDVLKAAMARGVIGINDLHVGQSFSRHAADMAVLDTLAVDTVLDLSPIHSGFFDRFFTPQTVARRLPFLAPLVDDAIRREHLVDAGKQAAQAQMYKLNKSVAAGPRPLKEVAKDTQDIYDLVASMDLEDHSMAAAEISRAAAATGDEQIMEYAAGVSNLMYGYRQRLLAINPEMETIKGYFPRTNVHGWQVTGGTMSDFKGRFKTIKDAKEAILKMPLDQQQGLTIRATGMSYGGVASSNMDAKTMSIAFNNILEELGGEWDATVSEFFQASGIGVKKPNKIGSPHIRKRVLRENEWTRPPLEAMDSYISSMERHLNFHDFKQVWEPFVDVLPKDAMPGAHRWTQQYMADVMGDQRPWEAGMNDALTNFLGVPTNAVRRWSGYMRSWQSISKLGGFNSAITNSTQVALNTLPLVGVEYTAKGYKHTLARWRTGANLVYEGMEEVIDNAVPLGGDAALGEFAGGFFSGAKNQLLIGKKREAVAHMSLYAFHKVEQINRAVSANGAYLKHLAKNPGDKAGAIAAGITTAKRTQFEYAQANMPEILRGPGGAVLGQFKSFWINELEFVAGLSGKEAAKFTAYLTGLGGVGAVAALPGVELINHASGFFMDEKISEYMHTRMAGKAEREGFTDDIAGRALSFGLPGIFDLDMSRVVGAGGFADLTSGLLGPTVSDAAAIREFVIEGAKDVAAFGHPSQQTATNMLRRVMPSQIRRLADAISIYNTGEIRNTYSDRLIYQADNRYMQAMRQFVGPQPVRRTMETEMDIVAGRINERYTRRRADINKELAAYHQNGEQEKFNATMQKANTMGYGIKPRDIQYYIKQRGMTAAERRLRGVQRAARWELDEMYEFTGTLPQP
jgi:hypothetical protein